MEHESSDIRNILPWACRNGASNQMCYECTAIHSGIQAHDSVQEIRARFGERICQKFAMVVVSFGWLDIKPRPYDPMMCSINEVKDRCYRLAIEHAEPHEPAIRHHTVITTFKILYETWKRLHRSGMTKRIFHQYKLRKYSDK